MGLRNADRTSDRFGAGLFAEEEGLIPALKRQSDDKPEDDDEDEDEEDEDFDPDEDEDEEEDEEFFEDEEDM